MFPFLVDLTQCSPAFSEHLNEQARCNLCKLLQTSASPSHSIMDFGYRTVKDLALSHNWHLYRGKKIKSFENTICNRL